MESSALAQRYSALRHQVHQALPQEALVEGGTSLADAITSRLDKEFENPRTHAFSVVMKRETSPEELRRVMFFPQEQDMPFFVKILARLPPSMPAENPQRQLQIAMMGVMYLVHMHAWPLMAAFLGAGGGRSLVSLFTDENEQLRAQAVDTLLQATAHPGFDWFTPPPDEESKQLHRCMLSLGQGSSAATGASPSDTLVAACLANADNANRGTSLYCLQLLAFWLSWARKLHTADGTLQVSQALVDAFAAWAGKEPSEGDTAAVPQADVHLAAVEGGDAEVARAIRELAAKLHADFSRFVAPSVGAGGYTAGSRPAASLQASGGAAKQTPASQPASPPQDQQLHAAEDSRALDALTACEAGKLQGNAAYKDGKGATALKHYAAALAAAADAHSAALTATPEQSDVAKMALTAQGVLCSNVAAVFLRMGRWLRGRETAAAAPPTPRPMFEEADAEAEAKALAAKRTDAVGASADAPQSSSEACLRCAAAGAASLACLLRVADGRTPLSSWVQNSGGGLSPTGALVLPWAWQGKISLATLPGALADLPPTSWRALGGDAKLVQHALKSLLRVSQSMRMVDEPRCSLAAVNAALQAAATADGLGTSSADWSYLLPQLRDMQRELETEVALLAKLSSAPHDSTRQDGWVEDDAAGEVLACLLGASSSPDLGEGLEEAEAAFEARQARRQAATPPVASVAPTESGLGSILGGTADAALPAKPGISARAVATANTLSELSAALAPVAKKKQSKKAKKTKKASLDSVLAGFG